EGDRDKEGDEQVVGALDQRRRGPPRAARLPQARAAQREVRGFGTGQEGRAGDEKREADEPEGEHVSDPSARARRGSTPSGGGRRPGGLGPAPSPGMARVAP